MAKTLTASKRDRKIELLRYTPKNVRGDAGGDYVSTGTTWAFFRVLKSSEAISGGENLAQVEVEFQIRQQRSNQWISAADRVAYAGRIYEISGVEPIGRGEGWSIKAFLRDAING